MKLIILGAGASFDSVYEFYDDTNLLSWRPPLANELFDTRPVFRNIIESYPGGRYYISQLNAIMDIEDFFQKQWEFIRKHRAEDLAASFLNLNYCLAHLMFSISENYKNAGLSNYDILISKAYEYAINKKEDVVIVTFNYDTLLENSFAKLFFGEPRKLDIAEYTKYPVKIIKPHGSCNWVRRFDKKYKSMLDGSISNNLFQLRTSLKDINLNLEDEMYTIDIPHQAVYFGQPNEMWYCFPQLLIPLKDKDDFILPKAHQEYLDGNVNKAEDILIIGWKGTEAKFQHLLKTNIGTKRVNVTSVNAGVRDIETTLRPSLQNASFYHFEKAAAITRYDNWKEINVGQRKRILNFQPGSFSSYMLNVTRGGTEGFFNY